MQRYEVHVRIGNSWHVVCTSYDKGVAGIVAEDWSIYGYVAIVVCVD